MQKPFRVLVVLPKEWSAVVIECVRTLNIEIVSAPDRHTALNLLHLRPGTDVVLTASILADGTWKDLLNDLAKLRHPPQVIVASRLGDVSLWCDVLESGAYDLLAYPFVPHELQRMLQGAFALRHSRRSH